MKSKRTTIPKGRLKIANMSTGHLRMKASDAQAFVKTIVTLTIATSPTWRTEHQRYIRERLKIIAALEGGSLLSAMITDHETRHDKKIITYHHSQWLYVFEEQDNTHTSRVTPQNLFTTSQSPASPTRDQKGRFTRQRARSLDSLPDVSGGKRNTYSLVWGNRMCCQK